MFYDLVNCPICDEEFEFKKNKVYCSRRCKEKDKSSRKRKLLHKQGLVKPISEVSYLTLRPEGLYKNYKKQKEYMLNRYYVKKFGYTREQVLKYKSNNKNCHICGTTVPRGKDNLWHLDHIKGTKIIRGLLCNNCNMGIGFLNHDIDVLEKAIKYLKQTVKGIKIE